MNADERDLLHEMLCAYVLGEATDEERARVEAALAESAELRAERAQLEATIGLVQDAFPADETLSDEALSQLMTAASGARGSGPSALRLVGGGAWYQAPLVRAAAAVVALLGGVFGALQYPAADRPEAVAVLDQVVVPRGEAVRHLLDEVAALRASSAVGSERHAQTKTIEELRQQERYELLSRSREALRDKDYTGAARFLGEARQQHQGNADIGLALRLTERENDDALRYLSFKLDGEPERAALDDGKLGADGSGGQEERSLAGVRAQELQDLDAPVAGETSAPDAQAEGRSAMLLKGSAPADKREQLARKEQLEGQPPVDGPARVGDGAGKPSAPELRLRAIVTDQLGANVEALELARAGVGPVGGGQVAPSASGNGSAPGQKFGRRAPETTREVEGKLANKKSGELESLGQPESGARRALSGELLGEELGDLEGRVGADSDLYYFSLEQGENAVELDDLEPWIAGQRRALTPPEVEQRVDERFELIRRHSLPLPGEQPHEMFYRWYGDNPFVVTARDRLATFSVDVDTASYVLARRYLNDGYLPEKAQIRTEEFVNYFRPDLPAPTTGTFAVSTELAPSPFAGSGPQKELLRVGVRGKEVQSYERKPLVLTFVIDTSGSMREDGRLELVKHALGLLLGQLDARDMVGVVTYSKEANQLLPPTSASNRGLFDSLVGPLQPNGGTNAEAGLQLGYEVAARAYDPQADNRVVFLSDGVANIGETDQDRINGSIVRHREQSIFLNTIGVGMGNHNDAFLEQLADKGDGICDYIDDERAAERAIVERFSGAFTPIASDVKIQVEFDPNQVLRYRLLGYENRAIADQDFRNDAVDAGEVGAGHQVTALFEIERGGYGTGAPIANVQLRWKPVDGVGLSAQELAQKVYGTMAAATFDSTSAGFQRAALAAQFAEFLRRSVHAEQDSYPRFVRELERVAALPALAADADTQELLTLARMAEALVQQASRAAEGLERTLDDYLRYRHLREELRGTEAGLGQGDLRALQQTELELEDRLRRELRADVARGGR